MATEYKWLICIAPHVVVRPWLWRTAWRFKPNGRLLPPREFLEFRYITMYGVKWDRKGKGREFVRFMNWARTMDVY